MKIVLRFISLGVGLCFSAGGSANSTIDEVHPVFERRDENERTPKDGDSMSFQDAIVDGILFIQQLTAQHRAGEAGRGEQPVLRRGTHAKGTCAKGLIEITHPVPGTSFFSSEGIYETKVRFANASSSLEADQTPDVRSLSLSMNTGDANSSLDLSLNNAPTFPIPTAEVFAAVVQGLKARAGLAPTIQLTKERVDAVSRASSLGEEQKTPLAQPYQLMTYYSGVPFLMGTDRAVKYRISPCERQKGVSLEGHQDPNALQVELRRHVSEDVYPYMENRFSSCFELDYQVLSQTDIPTSEEGQVVEATYWIEDASRLWPESKFPYQRLGTLKILRHSIMTEDECEGLSFSAFNQAFPLHRGLGSINRARSLAESESAKKRRRAE